MQALQPLGDPAVQLRAGYRRYFTVQELPVQRMQELEVRGNRAIGKFIHPNKADESPSVRERFARLLDHIRVACGSRSKLPRRKAHPGGAGCLQNGPLEGARLIELQLKQLLQSERHIHRKRAAGRSKLPAFCRFQNEPSLEEVVDDGDHEKRIAARVAVDEVDELNCREAPCQLRREVLRDIRSAKTLDRQLTTAC